MADETVGSVQRLVREQSGQSADREPEHRRNDSVVEAFREAFDCCSRHALRRELRRIAPDDFRHCVPRCREVALCQWPQHIAHVRVETSLREAQGCDQHYDDHSERELSRAERDRSSAVPVLR